MDKKPKLIPLKELNLTNRFLFDEVLEDPQAHQDALSIIFGREIPLLDQNETEKELRVSPLLRAIIFLNTRGKNKEEVSEELIDFLHYVEHTTDQAAADTDSERIKRIHQRVRKVKTSEEAGVRYMQAWEEKYYEREEGREEGRVEGIRVLISAFLEEGFDKEKIVKKLQKAFSLNEEKAKEYYDMFKTHEDEAD